LFTGSVDIHMFEQDSNTRLGYEGYGIISGTLARKNSYYPIGIASKIIECGSWKVDKRIINLNHIFWI
jgi:hypothetical protein